MALNKQKKGLVLFFILIAFLCILTEKGFSEGIASDTKVIFYTSGGAFVQKVILLKKVLDKDKNVATLSVLIPSCVDKDSITAFGINCTVENMVLKRTYLLKLLPSAVKSLREEIKKTKQKLNLLYEDKEAILSVIKNMPLFLEKNLDIKDIDSAKSWMKFFYSQQKQLRQKLVDTDREISLLKDKLKGLENQLKLVNGDKEDSWVWEVSLKIRGEKTNDVSLVLSYLIESAGWDPSYKINLNRDKKSVEFCYYASVWQKSYEDFDKAKIVVSTAPYVGMLKRLSWGMLNVDFGVLRRLPPKGISKTALLSQMVGQANFSEYLNELTYGKEFVSIKNFVNVPSTGESLSLLLWRGLIKASELSYICRPYIDKAVYRVVKVTNSAPVSILSGKADVYIDGDYVGKLDMPFIPKGGSKRLYLGQEPNIAVKRKPLELKDVAKGILNKKGLKVEGYITEITNNLDTTISLYVEEAVPVPKNPDIKLYKVNVLPAGYKKDKLGHYKWKFSLKPHETIKVKVTYQILYPKDKRINIYLKQLSED